MSRVRQNAKSIENRYNSFKILTKLFETFCPLHERPRHFEKVKQLINILFCGYQRRLEIADPLNDAETYTRLGHRMAQRVIISSNSLRMFSLLSKKVISLLFDGTLKQRTHLHCTKPTMVNETF